MRFAVLDKATANLLWWGECSPNAYENQKASDGQVVIPIDILPDPRRRYRLNEFNELDDIGISQYGEVMEKVDALQPSTT
jgi:hypothetical protein